MKKNKSLAVKMGSTKVEKFMTQELIKDGVIQDESRAKRKY